jgi:NADPH:quinone reductase-like Zn-dependent oxidoreductase
MSQRQIHSLGIEGAGRAYVFPYVEGDLPDGHVRLKTLYSGFSAGTEFTFLKHTNPYFHSRWDGYLGVFIAGEPSLDYPVPFLGYMEVARVTESRTPAFQRGQVLATTFGHKSGHTADPVREVLIPLPTDLHPMLGIFVAQMGPIAANGILHADAEHFGTGVTRLGQSLAGKPVLVIGGGTVGLMTALFARRAGACEIVVADPSPFRRERLQAMGLSAMTENEAWHHARTHWHGGGERGVEFAFQTRAHAASLHTALRALRPQGTVIDLAFYQGGAEALRLGEEFHHNGLSIRCAQINRVPRGLAHLWDRKRLALETVELLQGEAPALLREIITHIVPLDDAPAFLAELIENRPDFMQIVFQVDR